MRRWWIVPMVVVAASGGCVVLATMDDHVALTSRLTGDGIRGGTGVSLVDGTLGSAAVVLSGSAAGVADVTGGHALKDKVIEGGRGSLDRATGRPTASCGVLVQNARGQRSAETRSSAAMAPSSARARPTATTRLASLVRAT